ncbi:MAG: hypothetical protein ACI4J8_05925 [Oscillospiraceae bacterium]
MFVVSVILALIFFLSSISAFIYAATGNKPKRRLPAAIAGALCCVCALFFGALTLRFGGCLPLSEAELLSISESRSDELKALLDYSLDHHGFIIDASGMALPYRKNENSPAEKLPAEIEREAFALAAGGLTRIRAFDGGVMLYSPNFSRKNGTTCGLFYGEFLPLDEQISPDGHRKLYCKQTENPMIWLFFYVME